MVSEAIQNGGIVQLFGCGHSHILTEEVFYRRRACSGETDLYRAADASRRGGAVVNVGENE